MTPKRSIIPVFVPHLGCPNNCVFCNQRRIAGQTKPACAESVRLALDGSYGKLPEGVKAQLAYYGGSFTAIPEQLQNELLDAAQPYLREGAVDSLRLSTRPDAIDAQTLDRLKEYGVKTIELGAQSMCDEVLKQSGRGHTAEQTEKAARLVRAAGFELILQMMTGLPGDSLERSIETAERIIALKPDGVRIYPTVIIEDTPLCELWRRGEYAEHTVEQAVEYCAELLPRFERARIPIIRLGLNPSDELSCGGAVGGAYHPALGELVRSRVLYKRARELLEDMRGSERVLLFVHPSQISMMVGQHRENIERLQSELGIKQIKIHAGDVPKGALRADED